MPMMIRTIDQIMAERRADTCLIHFPRLMFDAERAAEQSRCDHFRWFAIRCLAWEIAAPAGWISGDPGIYALHCTPDDPRITAYTAVFETPDGISRAPETYQMVVMPYEAWLRDRGRSRPLQDDGAGNYLWIPAAGARPLTIRHG